LKDELPTELTTSLLVDFIDPEFNMINRSGIINVLIPPDLPEMTNPDFSVRKPIITRLPIIAPERTNSARTHTHDSRLRKWNRLAVVRSPREIFGRENNLTI